MEVLRQMAEAVIAGEVEKCVQLAEESQAQGIDPAKAIQEGFSVGMQTVGVEFESGRMFLPEMMQAADAMNAGVAVLKSHIVVNQNQGLEGGGTVLLATIQGDMHDIGKNIVKLLMTTSGFEVVDLGKDVKVSAIVEQAEEKKAEVIGVSALMTTTMAYMPEVLEELEELGIRDRFIVMVGGAPVTEEWAREIGSDGYAKEAVGAVRVAKELLAKKSTQPVERGWIR